MNLAGLHDREAAAIAPPDTWILDTVALSENPQPTNHVSSLHWITRLNHGYGSTGTLPFGEYGVFAQKAAAYVAASKGCYRWIIGNEPNLSREWPNGQPIFPWHYADYYKQCYRAIHAVPGHGGDEVLIAAPGPWNNELKYPGNPNGDWIKYFEDVINLCDSDVDGEAEMDGFSIHGYTHGYNVALVTSSARMQAPFQSRHYEFRAYRDYLEAIPDHLNHLPVYMTEANGNGPWQAVGLMPAMLGEIDAWNQVGEPKVQCVIFYRWPKYDQYYIEGRGDVIAEYKAAVGLGLTSPEWDNKVNTFIPAVSSGPSVPQPAPDLPPRIWDERLTQRGVTIETPPIAPGQKYWRVVRARWFDEQEAQGRHHIYVEARDENDGRLLADVPFLVTWPSGQKEIDANGRGGFDAGNYPMSKSLNEFSIRGNGYYPSETLKGIGMGANGNSGIHTSTGVVFQLATMPASIATGPQPPSKPQTRWVIARAAARLRDRAPDGDTLAIIPFGKAVTVQERVQLGEETWARVSDGNQVGWMANWLLGDEPTPTPVQPAPAPSVPTQPMPVGVLDPQVLEAILQVESGGRAFGADGKLLVRFEAHVFRTKLGNDNLFWRHFHYNEATPWTEQTWRADGAAGNWQPIHTGKQADEYAALEFAKFLIGPVADPGKWDAAHQSISMGAAQIMGFNHARIGYSDAMQMFDAFQRSINAQLIGFINFLLADPALVAAVNNKDFRTVARLYNGSGQVDHYASLMQQAYEKAVGA